MVIVIKNIMKTVINIKADKDVKESAQKVAQDLGIPLSTIINAYLKQFIRNKSVYFSSSPKVSTEFENLLGSIEKDVKNKKNISNGFSSVNELANYLDSL